MPSSSPSSPQVAEGPGISTCSRATAGANSSAATVPEVFTLHVKGLTLIDTAEERSVWASRARLQWGDGRSLVLRVSCNSGFVGSFPPRKLNLSESTMAGVRWDDEPGLVVPIATDTVLFLGIATSKHPDQLIGMGMLNGQSMITEGRQFAKFCIHILPTLSTIDSKTVQAVLDAELHSSLLDDKPENNNFGPLEYNYGSVRVSTLDFFYPSFLLTSGGQYIVSNVICAMNMTESSSLAMQLVPLKDCKEYVIPAPNQVITVRPQQRVYFSATWVLGKVACMKPMELQLSVNGSHQASAPIIINVHNRVPQNTPTDAPFQYWVNTSCVTNRLMLPSQELPLIRAVLPVYRFLGSGPVNQTEGIIVAFDKDRGRQVLVRANGIPVQMGTDGPSRGHGGGVSSFGGNGGVIVNPTGLEGFDFSSKNEKSRTSASQLLSSNYLLDTNASFVVRDVGAMGMALSSTRGPLLNLSQKTCMCTIILGTIRGFPMVLESTTGISPSFQVSITLLDQRGWQVVVGETLPSYQSASGSLRWSEHLVLRKWPGAESNQFMRLNLTEVRPRDGDETPIGAGLISLSRMERTYAVTPLSVAFYMYETYSLYDQLNSPSLLMKDANVVFSEMR